MNRFSSIVLRFSALACALFLSTGCGGGNIDPLPPVAARAAVSGRVLVTTAALPARATSALASLISDQPIVGATVAFYLSGSQNPVVSTTTDATGSYHLALPLGAQGELRATQHNRLLMSTLVLAMNQIEISKDITLTSTLTYLLKHAPTMENLTEEDIESILLLGEADDLVQQVVNAFKHDEALTVSDDLLTRASLAVKVMNEESASSCQEGQEWCVVVSRLKAEGSGSSARVLLRRVAQSLADGVLPGTVGAGDFTVQWPEGNQLQSLAPDSGFGASGLEVDASNPDNLRRNRVLFVVSNPQGLNETSVLMTAHLNGPPPATENARAIVVDQKLRGVLSQKRSLSRGSNSVLP